MKIGQISINQFSYKEDHSLRFTNSNYVLAIKDEDFPDKNVIPLIYFNNGKVEDIFEEEMDKIFAVNSNYAPEKNITNFKNLNQLLKISHGNIIQNDRYYDNENLPKCKTFASNINATDRNDVIEVIKGYVEEASSRIKINEPLLESLIIDVYIEDNIPIFIITDDFIIGPFKVLSKDMTNEGYFNVEKHLWKTFGQYKITDESFIEFDANNINRKIHIPAYNKFDLIKTLDFKNNSEIIKDFKSKLIENSFEFEKDHINMILNIINKVSKVKSISEYIDENKRIAEILKNTENVVISNSELAHLIPEIKNVKNEIEKLQNQEFDLKQSISTISTRVENIRQEILNKENDLELLNKELEDLNKFKKEESLKAISELNNEINRLQNDKNNLKDAIINETAEKSVELNALKQNVEEIKKEKEDLDFTVTELRQENRKVQRDAQEELINVFRHKKYFDFLSGRDLSEFDKKEDLLFNDLRVIDKYDDYISFKNDIISILNKNGRSFESHFIDNLLISIHQNTLTILAGLPGTGKTSLARLLSRILAPNERISEVSVGRGWSSQKDLIGFQNPLTHKFHSASTGIYELLTQLDYEIKNDQYLNSPFSYIILDEANLSPIEHYWSTFYNLTDSTATYNNFLSIQLGNNLKLEFANNIRFIATINYDQTTEGLSPRVIDRANIIQIPTNTFSIDSISKEEIEKLNISYLKCIEFFKLFDFQNEKQNIELSDELNNIFNDIKKRFKTLRIPISPRIEISIKQYCSVAKDYMKKEVSRPLDYCIAQRLLPMINLQGDSAKNSLEDLLDIFDKNDLKKSKEILTKIINTGNEDGIFEGSYNYFLTLSYA